MISLTAKVTKKPTIEIKPPQSADFWKLLALQIQRLIRKRTETQKVDHKGRRFKPYSERWKKIRTSGGSVNIDGRKTKFPGGLSSTPNLSFSGKMLGAMQSVGRRTKGIIRLSGSAGFKAYVNELKGRVFFDISKQEADKVASLVADKVAKDNKLKKR